MNSYNHYAFGSVVAWIYQCVAGIDTASSGAGFHEIIIHPRLDARITQARGEYDSMYGKIIADWNGLPSGPFELKVSIPPNTTAKVILPEIAKATLTQNGKRVRFEKEAAGRTVRIGSGTYEFKLQ